MDYGKKCFSKGNKLPSLDKKKRHPKAKLMNINLIMGLVEQTAISFKK